MSCQFELSFGFFSKIGLGIKAFENAFDSIFPFAVLLLGIAPVIIPGLLVNAEVEADAKKLLVVLTGFFGGLGTVSSR